MSASPEVPKAAEALESSEIPEKAELEGMKAEETFLGRTRQEIKQEADGTIEWKFEGGESYGEWSHGRALRLAQYHLGGRVFHFHPCYAAPNFLAPDEKIL